MRRKAQPDGHPGCVDQNTGTNSTVCRGEDPSLKRYALASLGHSLIIAKFSGGIAIYHRRYERQVISGHM